MCCAGRECGFASRSFPSSCKALPRAADLDRALVDRVVPKNDYDLLVVLGGASAAFIVFHFPRLVDPRPSVAAVRTLVDARMTLDSSNTRLRPTPFFQQRSAGDLMMRLNSNASVREIITAGVLSALLDGGFVTLPADPVRHQRSGSRSWR